MKKGTLFPLVHDVTPANMKQALQQAIEIEIATIPVYLYTYYSIIRTPDQQKLEQAIQKDLMDATGKTKAQTAKEAHSLGVDLMVYSNKVGALIMSVVIEEMLHMALSSNVKQAIAGMPELVGKTPKTWPAYLPGHEPGFPINRGKLSLSQLYTFLLIESPKPFSSPHAEKGKAIAYTTIGEYYAKIEKCIKEHYKDESQYNRAPQLVPGKGFYAQNTIDTVHYDAKHKPQFASADDSGDLVHVVDEASALKALEEIVEQGEGGDGGNRLKPNGDVVCPNFDKPDTLPDGDYDDPTHKELSHFDKFLEAYCLHKKMTHIFNKAMKTKKGKDFDFDKYYVLNFADNPSTTDYPENIQTASTLTNAVYTYIFVMTEGCYRKAGNTQFEIFMFGIHKSMIWILNSLCGQLAGMTYKKGKQEYAVAPTFEDYDFTQSELTPKAQLIGLANETMATYSDGSFDWVLPLIEAIPDVEYIPAS